jgi:hypothetical protein
MRKDLGKRCMILFLLLAILAFSLIRSQSSNSASAVTETTTSAEQKTLAFLVNVVGLDLSKYRIIGGLQPPALFLPGESAPRDVYRERILYNLNSSFSEVSVDCCFANGFLVWCDVNYQRGLPLSVTPLSSDNLEAAKTLINRYQDYVKQILGRDSSYLSSMKSAVEGITQLETMSITVGNFKLETSSSSIKWIYTDNGINVSKKSVGLDFGNGKELSLSDGWNLYSIGNSSCVSEADAYETAWVAAEGFVIDLKARSAISHDAPHEVFFSMMPRGNISTVLFPQWEFVVYFNQPRGQAVGIQVRVWGDTGKVALCEEVYSMGSIGGGNTSISTPQTSATPSPNASLGPLSSQTLEPIPKPNQQTGLFGTGLPLEYGYAIVAVLVIIVAGASLLVYFKKLGKWKVTS